MFEFDPLQLYVGKRYGRLTVISEERDSHGNWFNCKCDCGNSIRITNKRLNDFNLEPATYIDYINQ